MTAIFAAFAALILFTVAAVAACRAGNRSAEREIQARKQAARLERVINRTRRELYF